MSERITIHNKTQRTLCDALTRVADAIAVGSISRTAGREHPCHVTVWADGVAVICRTTRAGHLSVVVQHSEVDRDA